MRKRGNKWVVGYRVPGEPAPRTAYFNTEQEAKDFHSRTKLAKEAIKIGQKTLTTKNNNIYSIIEKIVGVSMVKSDFVKKYHELYANPNNSLASIIDELLADIGLPITFDDIRKIHARGNKGRIAGAKLRQMVLERDGFRCVQCGDNPANGAILEIDHIVPWVAGGLTEERNLQTLCQRCNAGKMVRIPKPRKQSAA